MNSTKQQWPASVIVGLGLIALGVIFLVTQALRVDIWNLAWPLIVVAFGLLFFVGMVMGGKETGPMAIPGAIITVAGLVLFVMNLVNGYAAWAYAWALVAPAGVGLGFIINGWWSGRPQLMQAGRSLVGIGLALFVGFGAFFELVIGLNGLGSWSRIVWPVLLILLGIALLLGRSLHWLDWTRGFGASGWVSPPADKPSEKQDR